MTRQTVFNVITWFFIFLFTYAALAKLTDYSLFRAQISFYPALKYGRDWVPWLLPTVELATAALLVFRCTQAVGIFLSFCLMLVFTIYIAVAMVSGLRLPCSCGGLIQKMSWGQHLVFNFVCLAMASWALFSYPSLPDRPRKHAT